MPAPNQQELDVQHRYGIVFEKISQAHSGQLGTIRFISGYDFEQADAINRIRKMVEETTAPDVKFVTTT